MPAAAITFVLLVALCWVTFFAVPRRLRPHLLTLWGVAFYVAFAAGDLWLVAAVLVLTYLGSEGKGYTGVVATLALLLAYFKLPSGAGAPLGFSFLAFELMHYAIDRGRGRIPRRSFVDLAAFAFFFPCRVAGPIKRYPAFTESVASATLSPDVVTQGCLRIGSGLVKKVVFADLLLKPLAAGLATSATAVNAWTAAIAYSLQLYCDFSAYSDIAIGISLLMGIRVPENFNWPYVSENIQEFWKRWHMSLTSWVTEYVFQSVGRQLFKTRLRVWPGVIATVGYLLTFLTVGAWHGLTPNFLAWGAFHGVLMTLFHFYKALLPMGIAASPAYRSTPARWASVIVTFALVTIGWVFFRLSPPDAVRTVRLMLLGHGSGVL